MMTLNFVGNLFARRFMVRAAAMWFTAAIAMAQSFPSCTLSGRVQTPGTVVWSGQMVQVEPMSADGFVHRTAIHPDGSFEVRDLSYGTHWVSLLDSDGGVLWRGMVPVT